MKQFKLSTILVPIDFSETAENALKHALHLATRVKAKLVLVHVVELTAYVTPAEMFSIGYVTEQMVDASKINLAGLREKLMMEYPIEIECASYCGNVYDNIIRAAHLFNTDLIIMGTHGTSGIKEWLFGSNAFSVVSNTTIPVLTIQQKTLNETFTKIVFPYNENLLTIKKIEEVVALAKIFNAEILILGFSEDNNPTAIQSIETKGNELTQVFTNEKITNSYNFILGDNYADAILEFALDKKADMITVATTSAHNMQKVFKGKPSKKLINHSEIPVLSVPVEL